MLEEKLNRIYEVGFLVTPSIPEESIKQEFQKTKEKIIEAGGLIISEGNPEMKSLAYTLEKKVEGVLSKFDQAYLGYIRFELNPSDLPLINKFLNSQASVIRFIIIGVDIEKEAVKTHPSIREKSLQISEPAAFSEEEIDKSIEELIKES